MRTCLIALFIASLACAPSARAQAKLSVADVCAINGDVERTIQHAGKRVEVIGVASAAGGGRYVDLFEWRWQAEKGARRGDGRYVAAGCHINVALPESMHRKLVQPHLAGQPEPSASYYWQELSCAGLCVVTGTLETDNDGRLLLYLESVSSADPEGYYQ